MTAAYSIITTDSTLVTTLPRWQPATWADYLSCCDRPNPERARLFFNQGYLFIEMGTEGINHAWFSDLFTTLFFTPDGRYEQCADSTALNGLAIATLDQTLVQVSQGSSSSALSWFAQEI